MNLLPIWVRLPPGNAFPYSLTRGLKFYKLTVLLRRPFKHLVFMRIQGNLQNEFEHMDELNLKTHTHRPRGKQLPGCGGDIDFLELLTRALGFACALPWVAVLV